MVKYVKMFNHNNIKQGGSFMKVKNHKHIHPLIIAVGLVLILTAAIIAPVYVTADDTYGDFTYSVSNGNATITGYNGTGDSLSIPANIGDDNLPVTGIGSNAFKGRTGLTSLTIPSSVMSIGDYAFQNCSGLISLTIVGNNITDVGQGNRIFG